MSTGYNLPFTTTFTTPVASGLIETVMTASSSTVVLSAEMVNSGSCGILSLTILSSPALISTASSPHKSAETR